jgi:hypothetical protein
MKIYKKIAVLVLIIAAGFIVISGSILSDQAASGFDQYACLVSAGDTIPVQGKEKYQYVGMEKCASICHNNEEMGFQYNIVKSSPHANAFKHLVTRKAFRYAKKANIEGSPQVSAVCLRCHTTGAALDSTSLTVTYRKEDGVTCEACHKGEFISKTFLPKEADCLKCHSDSVHKIPEFDFSADCKKIAHPRPKSKK